MLLAGLAGRGPVTVADLPVVPGEPSGVPRHRAVLTAVDADTLEWLRAQRAPYAAQVSGPDGPSGELVLTWTLPVPAGVFGPTG